MGEQGAGQHGQAQGTGTVTPQDKTLNVVVAIIRRDEALIAVAAVELWSPRAVHGRTPVRTQQMLWAARGAGSRLWTAHMTTAVLVPGTGAGTCD